MKMRNDEKSPRKLTLSQKAMIGLAGADGDIAIQCPEDIGKLCAVGQTVGALGVFRAVSFAGLAQTFIVPTGQIGPELIAGAGALGLAGFMAIVDAQATRSAWDVGGVEALRSGGLDLSQGNFSKFKSILLLGVRMPVSISSALLAAYSLGLSLTVADIQSRISASDSKANAELYAEGAKLVDDRIERATKAEADEDRYVAKLSDQIAATRTDMLQAGDSADSAGKELARLRDQKVKADQSVLEAETFAADELAGVRGVPGPGPRYKAAQLRATDAKRRAADAAAQLDAALRQADALRTPQASSNLVMRQEQLRHFEEALATETAKQSRTRDEVAELTRSRGLAIQAYVESSPAYVRPDRGLLGQGRVFIEIFAENLANRLLIGLIFFTSIALEMVGVFAPLTAFAPTVYAALLVRNRHLRLVNVVDEMIEKLNKKAGHRIDDEPANDNQPGAPLEASLFGGPEVSEPSAPENDPEEGPISSTGANDSNGGGSPANNNDQANLPTAANSGEGPNEPQPPRPRGRPRKYPLS
jgi:hypothetical protein